MKRLFVRPGLRQTFIIYCILNHSTLRYRYFQFQALHYNITDEISERNSIFFFLRMHKQVSYLHKMTIRHRSLFNRNTFQYLEFAIFRQYWSYVFCTQFSPLFDFFKGNFFISFLDKFEFSFYGQYQGVLVFRIYNKNTDKY